MEMTLARPKDKQQLAAISGVGDRKLERYGDAFLSVLSNSPEDAQEKLVDWGD
jgi:ATP-dependent DNA helicase RecQ